MPQQLPEQQRSARPSGIGVHPFLVQGVDGSVAGPYPSYDIALLAARQHDALTLIQVLAQTVPADYAEYRRHARVWFGGRVRAWLQAGMPDRQGLPEDAQLAAVDPRILARNGAALAAYLAAPPQSREHPLYDRIAARYLQAAYGLHPAPSAVRRMLESLHESYALRRLWHDRPRSTVVAAYGDRALWPCLGLQADAAARRLRLHARLYRGLGRHWVLQSGGADDYGKWLRFCRRSVLLPGITAAALYRQAKALVAAAAIEHGIDAGDETLTLRRAVLHLAQWRLATRAGILERSY